jgi:small-conductance mechanosensitive channel
MRLRAPAALAALALFAAPSPACPQVAAAMRPAAVQAAQDTPGALESNWGEIMATANDVLQYSVTIGGQQVNLPGVILFVAILLLTWGVSRMVRRGVLRILDRRGVDDPGTVAVATRILHYVIMGVGLLTGLAQVGINLSALFAAGAVFAVGVGFALQTLSENFVSGVILLVERSIKPGDILEVEDTVIRVQRMGIRTTIGRNRDDEEMIIPNSILASNVVKNYTFQDPIIRLRAAVGVAYESDLRQVVRVLEEMAAGIDWRLETYEPVILLREFGTSSVDFEVSVWISDPWRMPRRRSELLQKTWWALKDAGITIAFPQMDVHFDKPVEEALERLPRAS